MTTDTHRTYVQHDELGDLRRRLNDAARAGAVARGELPSLADAALERAGEMALAGRLAESRRVIELNYFAEETH